MTKREERLRARLRELAEGWQHSPHSYGPKAWSVMNSCANDLLDVLDYDDDDEDEEA